MFDRQAGVPMVVQSCDQPPPCDVLVNIGFSHSSHALAKFVFFTIYVIYQLSCEQLDIGVEHSLMTACTYEYCTVLSTFSKCL